MSVMVTLELYSQLQKEFADNECILQTSFEEFVSLSKEKTFQHCRLLFIGKCGHESSAVYTNFHTRKTGLNCKACVMNKLKEKAKDLDENIKNESKSISHLTTIMSHDFDIIRTHEGCFTNPDETKPAKHIKINPTTYKTNNWLKQYEFNYSNITNDTIANIKSLFSIL